MSELPLHVLLVIEHPQYREESILALHRTFEEVRVARADRLEAFASILERDGFDFALVDAMPSCHRGESPAQLLKERWPDCPIIAFTNGKSAHPSADFVLDPSLEGFARLPTLLRQAAEVAKERASNARQVPETEEAIKYRALFEASLDAIFVETIDGTILDSNPAAERDYGYTPEEFRGMNVRQLVPDEIVPLLPSVIDEHLAQRGVFIEALGKRKDGTLFPTEVSTHVGTINGEPRVMVYVRDITERKTTEEALRQSQQTLESLLGNVPGMVYRCHPEPQRTMLFVSEGAEELTGYAPEDLIQDRAVAYEALILPEDRQGVRTRIEQAIEDAQKFQLTYRIRTARGEIKWVWEQGRLSASSKEGAAYLEGLISDITNQKEIEERARLQAAALTAMDTAVSIIDAEGHFVWVNPAFTRLTGYTAEEVLGQPVLMLRSDEHSAEYYAWMQETKFSGKTWQGEIINRRKDGTLYVEYTTIAPVYDRGDAISHFVAIRQDVTERKQQEEKIARVAELSAENPHPVLRINAQGLLTYANRASIPLLSPWEGRVEQAVPDLWLRTARQARETEKIRNIEVQAGNQIFSLSFAASQRADYVNVYGRDITEQVRAEAEKQQRQERLERQRETLVHLSTDPRMAEAGLQEALALVVEAAAKTLEIEAASIWELSGSPDHMQCLASYPSPAVPRKAFTFPLPSPYLQAVEEGVVIAAPQSATDARTTNLRGTTWLPAEVQAVLDSPIRLHGRVVGVLCARSHGGIREWTSDEIIFTGQLADLSAQTLLNAALRRRAEELEAITRISREITSVADLNEVLTYIAQYATQLVEADGGGVFAFGPEDTMLTTGHGISSELIAGLVGEPPNGDPPSRLYRTLQDEGILHITDLSQSACPFSCDHLADAEVRTLLILPLAKDEELLMGGIVVFRNRARRFSQQEIAFLRALAQQSVNAVENARLLESLRQEKSGLEMLYHLSQQVTEPQLPQEVAQRALEVLVSALGAASSAIYLEDQLTGQPILAAHTDVAPLGTPAHGEEPERLVHWIWRNRQALLIPDTVQDSPVGAGFPDIPYRSAMGVPLITGKELQGVLILYDTRPLAFGNAHLRLAQSAGATTAIALANAQLFEELNQLYRSEQEKRELAEALAEAAAVVNSHLDPDLVLDRILEQVERVVDGETFNIMLVQNDEARIVRWRGYKRRGLEDKLTDLILPISKYPNLRRMMQAEEPIVISDTLATERWVRSTDSREWRRSYVGAPIRIAGETVGFLNANSTEAERFGPAEGQWLKAFADHAATAIQNARLFQTLRHHAGELETRVAERTVELQRQYAQLEAVLHSTSDGIIVTNGAGEVQLANPIATYWLSEVLPEADAHRLRAALHDLSSRAVDRPETVLEFENLDLELKAAPILRDESVAAQTVIAVHDVSHLKALERMKSQFITDVSHELRTPVTTIRLYAQLLRHSSPEKREQYLTALEEEVERQTKLVQEILQFSRIDAGYLELSFAPVDLNDLTETTLVSQRILAQERGVTLALETAQSVPTVRGDSDKLAQMLINIVNNAIRYTPGGGLITVTTGQAEIEGQAWATLEVQDTGLGIRPDELPYIFERFFRGREPRKRQIPGTGLGLAIAKEIVEGHGGWITVDSQPMRGSTFVIWLPPVTASQTSATEQREVQ
ncbi:MAG: PAS domain S-box protein [Anaerolineales bacterium]